MSLIFEIDPISFACGASSTGAVVGGFKWISSSRRKSSARGIDARRNKLLAEMKPKYASLDSTMAEVNELLDAVTHDFAFAYPNMTFSRVTEAKRKTDHFQKNLNTALENINTLENTHLNSKAINLLEESFNKMTVFMPDELKSLKAYISEGKRTLDSNQSDLVKFKNRRKEMQDRLTTVSDAYADAQSRFDKIYLEKIPPAIFQAEKQFATFSEVVDRYTFSPGHSQNARNELLNRALAAVTKAENAVNTAFNFSDTAKRATTKARVSLRNSLAPRDKGEEALRDVAILSLMEAESTTYDEGNPIAKFTEILAPYESYVRVRKTPKQRR